MVEKGFCVSLSSSTWPIAGAHIWDGKGIDGDGGKINPLLCLWSQSDLLGVWARACRDHERGRLMHRDAQRLYGNWELVHGWCSFILFIWHNLWCDHIQIQIKFTFQRHITTIINLQSQNQFRITINFTGQDPKETSEHLYLLSVFNCLNHLLRKVLELLTSLFGLIGHISLVVLNILLCY